jgi:hypothetical protein
LIISALNTVHEQVEIRSTPTTVEILHKGARVRCAPPSRAESPKKSRTSIEEIPLFHGWARE